MPDDAQPVDPWEHTPTPGSSNISEFRFDKNTDILQIDFNDESSYEYYNVPRSVNRAFQAAPSKGAFFARHIRNRFAYERL